MLSYRGNVKDAKKLARLLLDDGIGSDVNPDWQGSAVIDVHTDEANAEDIERYLASLDLVRQT